MNTNTWEIEFSKLNIYNYYTHSFKDDINMDNLYNCIINSEKIHNFYIKKQNFEESKNIIKMCSKMIIFVKKEFMEDEEYFKLCVISVKKDPSILLFINCKYIGIDYYCNLCIIATNVGYKSFKYIDYQNISIDQYYDLCYVQIQNKVEMMPMEGAPAADPGQTTPKEINPLNSEMPLQENYQFDTGMEAEGEGGEEMVQPVQPVPIQTRN